MIEVTKDALYICMGSGELDTLQRSFRAAGGHWSSFIIWAKNNHTLGHSDYQHAYEPILYGWKEGQDHFWCGSRSEKDVWFVDRVPSNDLHPTMKPVELIRRALQNSAKSRDTILDPFGGSGSTLIAYEATDRQARLIELEPGYVDVICKRFAAFTGLPALLEETGQDFAELEAARRAEETEPADRGPGTSTEIPSPPQAAVDTTQPLVGEVSDQSEDGSGRRLLSQKDYADARGWSKQYVNQLIKKGRIHLVDGQIDPEQADRALGRTRDPSRAAAFCTDGMGESGNAAPGPELDAASIHGSYDPTCLNVKSHKSAW
jgi:hypothetical protein